MLEIEMREFINFVT